MTSPVLQADPRRWKALGVLGLIQFMLILDITVVNVALPSIKDDLGFTESGLAWVVNGYVLAAGGFLLLGGRIADLFGRRRMFLVGISVFAIASALCGAAQWPWMLVAARFIQGTGEAMAAPASLGLIALLFIDPKERTKALGIFGGIAGLGGVSGTVISGVLTDLASWRWIFFINIPVAALALIAVPRLVSESKMVRTGARPDFAGALIGTAGLVAVVAGLINASTNAWGDAPVLLPLLGGIALIGLMVFVESRSESPLIPLEFFKNRTRVVTNGVTLFFSSAFFSYFFIMTLFQQQVLHYSPLKSGFSYTPFGVTITLAIGLGTALLPKLGVRVILGVGFLLCAVGMFMTAQQMSPDATYATGILPGMLVIALGSGMSFPAIGNAALHQVDQQNSSLASGVQASMQQVGGAIGLACLATIGLRHAASQMAGGTPYDVAASNGYTLALRIGGVLLLIGSVLIFLLLEKVSANPAAAMEETSEAFGEDGVKTAPA